MTPDSDLTVVHRAGRIAAAQASLALAAVLLVVGAVVFLVDIRVQEQQIRSQLSSVALAADDVTDPPPGMMLVLRDLAGKVAASADGIPTAELLARPAGFSEVRVGGVPYRVVVTDKPEGRVVALLDLEPHKAGRSRLLLSLGVAELAGIVASIVVVTLLTRRSIRPLAEALALQRRFVADASHELRAPLTVLHTRIQLLGRRFDDGDAQQTKEQIDALASDTRALGEVIEDLLASASMTSDNVPQERIDLATVVQAACESMAQHAETAGVNLVVEANGPSPLGDPAPLGDFVVLGSGSALRRAITSLVDNALAHEHRGGTIAVALSRHRDRVLIDVRDDGVGIDPGAMETLFNRFSRGQTHTAAGDRPRYGIGLALVREIANAHGGHITVAQTPGGGATFTLTIPAAPLQT
jgi:signal transduction histidine kinase